MKNFIGIDLHSNNSYIAVINEKKNILFKQKIPNNINTVLSVLEVYKKQTTGIAIESTFNWYWLVDALQENGYKVHLANPAAMQQYTGLKYTDDKSDAIWLAEMLRLNILPERYIFPKDERAIRDLLRKRSFLLQHRVALTLSLKNMLCNWNPEQLNRSWIQNTCNNEISNMLNDKHAILSATSLHDVITGINNKISNIEQVVLNQSKLKSEFKLLLSVWGIGKILAMTIMLETGSIHRFADAGKYSFYCRCVSSRKISNEKKKGSGNKKNGNRYLAWAYVEAAHFMRQRYEKSRSWYQRKASKKGNIVATKALSNKIARACYFVLRDQQVFDPVKLFG